MARESIEMKHYVVALPVGSIGKTVISRHVLTAHAPAAAVAAPPPTSMRNWAVWTPSSGAMSPDGGGSAVPVDSILLDILRPPRSVAQWVDFAGAGIILRRPAVLSGGSRLHHEVGADLTER